MREGCPEAHPMARQWGSQGVLEQDPCPVSLSPYRMQEALCPLPPVPLLPAALGTLTPSPFFLEGPHQCLHHLAPQPASCPSSSCSQWIFPVLGQLEKFISLSSTWHLGRAASVQKSVLIQVHCLRMGSGQAMELRWEERLRHGAVQGQSFSGTVMNPPISEPFL